MALGWRPEGISYGRVVLFDEQPTVGERIPRLVGLDSFAMVSTAGK